MTRPPDFVATDPAKYNWTKYDRLIEEAHKRNLNVLITLAAPMPFWASEEPEHCASSNAWSCGWKPKSREYARFVTAVGRHFLGKEIWGVTLWNEPNIGAFLNDDSRHLQAMRYRKMWFDGRKALRKTAGLKTRVFFGDMGNDLITPDDKQPGCQKGCETDPRDPNASCMDCGHTDPNPYSSHWKVFRQALCLDSAEEELPKDQQHAGCRESPRRVWSSGVAFHPYSPHPLVLKHSVEVLERFVDEAVRQRRLSCNQGIYLTEHAFLTRKAPKQLGASSPVTFLQQAEYMNMADRYLYEDPRVKTTAQYELYDEGRADSKDGWDCGLRYSQNENPSTEYQQRVADLNGCPYDPKKMETLQQCWMKYKSQPKPAFDAYRMSIDVVRTTPNQVVVFGLARSIAPATLVFVEQKRTTDADWSLAGTLKVDELGYGKMSFNAGQDTKFRLSFPLPSPSAPLRSREVAPR